ncbi:peroxiredoxin [Marinigracilibium pacificum]|uniref:thioredoxin-dependent peroxiredoxin n=1 Tax=Marinigracilibium pacificum TaxID=2729599 RepID=A0A848J0E1_9BACT|nr:peroxiredoxin [Marinigracilibium pacificum]NMM48020.1 peroxiredoxin [Marinigracilibium pacificum]
MPLKKGTKAPVFSLASTGGNLFSLEETLEGKPCILFFYPKDFTPGCTKEACGFRDEFDFFKSVDIPVFGISRDNLATHIQFKNKYDLPFDLLADENGKVSKLYNAKVPFINMTKRITYLLDQNHIIRYSYENLFGAEKHIDEMKNIISSIKVRP